MLAIKLQRIGKKHQPSYRMVVAEKRSKLIGPPVEDLGSYSVSTKVASLKKDRIAHWMKIGAQPTTTVWNLLVREGVVQGAKRKVAMKKVLRPAQDLREVEAVGAAPVAQAAAPAEVAQATP